MKKFLMALLGVLCVIFLLNPGAGILGEIPDNFPFIGNIDEASVTLVLLWVLRYFGIDVMKWFGQKDENKKVEE
jgi:hypothetical protein